MLLDRERKDQINIIKTDDNQIQFAIAVDLSKYPDQSFLMNPSNYNVSEGYEIIKVAKIPKDNIPAVVNQNDWVTIKNSPGSHYLVIKNKNMPLQKNLVVTLKNGQPKWVTEVSTNNDVNIMSQSDKTFGFKVFVDGISNAFSQINDASDFEIRYKIN